MKRKDEKVMGLAQAVKELFKERCGEFRAEDFVAVADLLGFDDCGKAGRGEGLKPVAENYFPDIIGTNLQYAVEAYVWEMHVPMTKDGKIVSGFWDLRKGVGLPEGYEIEEGGRFLRQKL